MANKKERKQHFFNNQFDFILFVTVLLLLSLGIIMVLSSSSPSSLAETGSSYTYVKKQAVSVVLGIIVMLIVSKIDYRFYKKFYKLAYIASIILLISVFVIGFASGGARRWIDLGFTTFQPSELVKILLIIFYAAILTDKKEKLEKFKEGFIYPLLYLIPIIGLLLLQPHMSASMVIIFVTAAMMIIAGCRIRYFLTIGVGVGIPGIIGMIILEPYRLKRLVTFLNPWSDVQGDGWQVIQSLYAIGSGGLFGTGLRTEQTKIFIYTRAA